MKRKRIPDDVRRRVVEMYQAEERVSDIQRELGLPRGTVYYLLDQEGIQPNRQARAESAERHPAGRKLDTPVDYDLIVDLLQRRVHELEAELESVNSQSH